MNLGIHSLCEQILHPSLGHLQGEAQGRHRYLCYRLFLFLPSGAICWSSGMIWGRTLAGQDDVSCLSRIHSQV